MSGSGGPSGVEQAELEFLFGELTRETPAPGVVVLQPRRGHRYGVEVYALAGFALGLGDAEGASVVGVELGAGSGVVSLLLASRGVHMTAVDLDPAWVKLASASLSLSREDIRSRITLEERDVRTLGSDRGEEETPFAADFVVTNPPWFDLAEGPASPDPRRAAARTMLSGRVSDFVDAGLRIAPRVCVATRVERRAELERPGSHLARWALLGRKVVLAEIRPGAGSTQHETLDLPAIYRSFRDRD